MKIVLDIDIQKKLENEDILVYRNGGWTNIPKHEYLAQLRNRVVDAENHVNEFNEALETFKAAVNEKLEQHHNILQVLTQEE